MVIQLEPICLMHIPNPVFCIIGNVCIGGERRRSVSANDVPSGRCLGPAPGACQKHRGPATPDISERCPGSEILRRDVSMPILQTSARDALPPRASKYAIDALTPSSPTRCGPERPDDRVPISQVPATDTPGTKTFVDDHISKPRMKPPDPNAYEVAPRLSARPVQEIQ